METIGFIYGISTGICIGMLITTLIYLPLLQSDWWKGREVEKHNRRFRLDRLREIDEDNTKEWEVRTQHNIRPDINMIFVEPWPKTSGGTIGFYERYGLGDKVSPTDPELETKLKTAYEKWDKWCLVKNSKSKPLTSGKMVCLT